MSVTPERLAEQRRYAEQLRREIATLDFAAREDLVEAELANQSVALDEEIARLEAQRSEKVEIAVRQGGGSVAEALAAMEAVERESALPVPAPSARPSIGVTPTATSTSTEGEGGK
jgi:uncharacterized small protein (DUF1192 family)